MSRRPAPRSTAGLMAAEMAFLLLILLVLGGLMASVYLRTRQESERSPAAGPPAVHQAKYFQYLSYVPERPGEETGTPPAAGDGPAAAREPRAAIAPEEAPPPLPPGADAAAAHPADFRPLSVLAGSGSLSGSGAAQGSGASADSAAPVDDTASVLAASPVFAKPSAATDEQPVLEVTVANVGGNPAAQAVPGASGAGGGSAGGTFLVGDGPGGGASGGGDGARAASQGSGSLVLIAVPANERAEPDTNAVAGSGGGSSGSDARVQGRGGGGPLRRVEFQPRGSDRWRRWPDANFRNITGGQGAEALNRAFELLQDSDAESIAADLFRKGIPILFGKPEDFSQPGAPAAVFTYPDSRPPDAPIPPPVLTFNPKFLHEDPRVLAAVLAHEGTHFQQYLDGSLRDGSADEAALETEAWNNGASAWQQVRRSAVGLGTPLVRDLEVGYQVARQGEGLLRDFVAALYTHDR